MSLGLWHNFGDDRSVDASAPSSVVRSTLASPLRPATLRSAVRSAEANFGRILRTTFAGTAMSWSYRRKPGGICAGPYGDLGSRKYFWPASTRACNASASTTSTSSITIVSTQHPPRGNARCLHSAVQQGKRSTLESLPIRTATAERSRSCEASALPPHPPAVVLPCSTAGSSTVSRRARTEEWAASRSRPWRRGTDRPVLHASPRTHRSRNSSLSENCSATTSWLLRALTPSPNSAARASPRCARLGVTRPASHLCGHRRIQRRPARTERQSPHHPEFLRGRAPESSIRGESAIDLCEDRRP